MESAHREPPRPIELPFRALRSGEEEWVVREGGRTAAGQGGGPRAPLLFLLFSRPGEGEPVLREGLVSARRLDDLSDDELLQALERARPHQPERERQEVFPDTRKRGSKGM